MNILGYHADAGVSADGFVTVRGFHLDEDGGQPLDFGRGSIGSFTSGDFSLDPYAGLSFGDKPIWTADEAADNLNRSEVNWTFGNASGLEDGVLTFGFWSSLEEMQNSYYLELDADGFVIHSDSVQIYNGYADVFSPEEQDAARAAIELWDDLIAISIEEAPVAEADITFGYVNMSPAAGAHAFYPQEDALNAFYGYEEAGRISGDVWLNWNYSGAVEGQPDIFEDMSLGSYGAFTLIHELGHSFGLNHGGDYNASDDNDGDGEPDPITYEGDAYFAQDTNQYTIMSYFDGMYTGQNAARWSTTGLTWMQAQTPAVHDILAVQKVYGADYSTRSGDTIYGFNSTADRNVFDFTVNDTPIITIWDGGGTDTLDLSGFDSDAIIDINQGAFSSAGYTINAEYKAALLAAGWTEEELAIRFTELGLGPDGRPVDNIAIAYGATIENAVGGSGDDLLISNELDNVLDGGEGHDTVSYDRADAGVEVDLVAQTATGGGGSDTLVSIESVIGSAFDDTLTGTDQGNTIEGGAGDDTLTGGEGNDTAVYARARAGVTVSLLAGTATGGDGTDAILGFENIVGSAFGDSLTGDAGDNELTGGTGADILDGGAGVDTAIYSGATGGVQVNLAAGTAAGADGADTLLSIENVVGSWFNDTITASNVDNLLDGGFGTDLVSYSAAGAGVNVNLETGVVTGGSGSDTLTSFERVIGSAHGDVLVGSSGANYISAGAGNDEVAGGDGLDVVALGSGNDTFVAELGETEVTLKTGTMSLDIITDFDGLGDDLIDLSGLGDFTFGSTDANKSAGVVTYKSYGNVNAAEKALGFDIDGQPGASNVSGPVTVVYGNIDGGEADFAIVLLGTSSVDAGDFILS